MSEEFNEQQSSVFRALAHPARIEMLNLLRHGEMCVCEFVPILGMEQSGVSRHLSILKKEGIVDSHKDGLRVIYRVQNVKVFEVLDLCADILKDYWHKKTFSMAR